MWGEIAPQWQLLRYHLFNFGPNYLSAQKLENQLILNRSNRPGNDVKDWLRSNSHKEEWKAWERAKQAVEELACHGAPLQFVQEGEATEHILAVARQDELEVNINYRQPREGDPHKDDRAAKRRRKDIPLARASA